MASAIVALPARGSLMPHRDLGNALTHVRVALRFKVTLGSGMTAP